jgi:CubicO group peptidase (beta-lactamase class C family)
MRPFLVVKAVLAALALVGVARAAAPPGRGGPAAPEALQAIDRLFTDNTDPAGPGAAVLVMQNGKVVFRKGYGLADLRKKTAVTPTTTFELASVSKPFTALAILILMERGKLGLDDDAHKYVPELPAHDRKRPIRVRDLLQHTSGLSCMWEITGIRSKNTTADFIKWTARRKLDFPTGSKWGYSSTNYRLLAVIVERVSGKAFPDFLRDEVFGPLGMKHTFVRDPSKLAAKGRAVGHTAGLFSKYRRDDMSVLLVGEAGVWSCLEDLARWERELRRPTLIRKATLEMAWTAGRLDEGKPIPYGLGWFVEPNSYGRKVRHSGGQPGFTTYFLRYPEHDVAVLILTNICPNPNAQEMAERAGHLMVDRPRSAGLKLTGAQTKALEGAYRREGKRGPARVEVVQRNGCLYLVIPGQLPYSLLPVSRTHFRVDGTAGNYLAFELEGGAVRRLRLESRDGKPAFLFSPSVPSP